MGMFAMRKPRGFNHSYIYVDERKEKLAKMEETPSVTWVCCRKGILARGYTGQIHRRNNSLEAAQGERT